MDAKPDPPRAIDLLEEDDVDWDPKEEDLEDVQQWEDDWDDQGADEDFSKQLRAELDKKT
eukprot:CAMPEP_0113930796 /NCGR_PEP_ID=MMETSP1159-20121227/6161_1 /TAXON_ID=88271 /ORGANISM="Picocystis salinarum" /LENGTH=59 /DNA_ID=CAMNT_0000931643 /DNA_START=62 /DNA_END=241 /DNA_ORIENTATION=- /assembly_acc=CAM_ASM_000767